ncbi:EG45-like domain containing protein [Linum perenne]
MLIIVDPQLQGVAAADRSAPTPAAENGTAGFFDSNPSSTACFGEKKQLGDLIGAADIRVFERKGACGRKFVVTCIGAADPKNKSVVIKIVDTCEPDAKNPCPTLLLSRKAFSSIANPNAGRAAISFKQ